MHAAEDLAPCLTVLITTSPASDHPRTELIEHVLASFRFVAGLADCRTIVVCDGYKVASSCNFRGGKVDPVRRENYEGYKEAIRTKIADRHAGWGSIELLELQEHYGFGFAVREALALVKTEYVCVVQHDRTFMRRVDMASVLRGMRAHADAVGYVLLPTSSTGTGRHYAHTQRSRLGQMGWRGCDLERCAIDLGDKARLLPCIQWYDSTHVCRTSYYINWVFGGEGERERGRSGLVSAPAHEQNCQHARPPANCRPPVPLAIRPGFIEDRFGQEQVRFWTLGYCGWMGTGEGDGGRARGNAGVSGGVGGDGGSDMLDSFVQTWKTWLLDDEQVLTPDEDKRAVAHLNGRTFQNDNKHARENRA